MPLTPTEARNQARVLVTQLRQMLLSVKSDANPAEALEFMKTVLMEPEKAEVQLQNSFLQTAASVEEAEKVTTELAQLARSPRKLLEMVKAELPRGEKGRPRRAGSDAELAQRAEWMIPFCISLMRLRTISAKTSSTENLHFLSLEFPDQCKWTLQHVQELDNLLRNRKLLKARSQDGRARNLAYVLAGMEFGLSRHYALRSVRSAVKRTRGR